MSDAVARARAALTRAGIASPTPAQIAHAATQLGPARESAARASRWSPARVPSPLPEGWRCALVVPGPPRTKKTHNRIVHDRRGVVRVVPSAAWEAWVRAVERAGIETADALTGERTGPLDYCLPDVPVNCAARFYRDAERGDATGYYQGLADLLEALGVVRNDRLIRAWDGSALLVDRKHPRTEITITPLEGGA